MKKDVRVMKNTARKQSIFFCFERVSHFSYPTYKLIEMFHCSLFERDRIDMGTDWNGVSSQSKLLRCYGCVKFLRVYILAYLLREKQKTERK